MEQQPFKNLDEFVKENKIPVKYPRGYQDWKQKFEKAVRENKGDVLLALEQIHQGNYPEIK